MQRHKPADPAHRHRRRARLDPADFRRVLVESGLGAQRPVDDPDRLRRMIDGADVIVTARLDTAGRPLVGVARGISDGAWACYLAEVAVTKSAQGLGVGRALLDGGPRGARTRGRDLPRLGAGCRRLLRADRHGAARRRVLVQAGAVGRLAAPARRPMAAACSGIRGCRRRRSPRRRPRHRYARRDRWSSSG